MRGVLPVLERSMAIPHPNVGPSLSFPVSRTPLRNASVGPVRPETQARRPEGFRLPD